MTGHIGRREFITLLGGAVAWPLEVWSGTSAPPHPFMANALPGKHR